MSPRDLPVEVVTVGDARADDGADLLAPLLRAAQTRRDDETGHAGRLPGVVIGELLAIADDGMTPLVGFPGQVGSHAVRARSCIDLHGPHVGAAVVLMFEEGDAARPLVLGVVRGATAWPLDDKPGHGAVEVDADGERLIVEAKEKLVLRCGKASITLTKTGKVLIEGSYLLSRSTGVNRVKGGSIQLN